MTPALRAALEAELGRICESRAVGGGCISPAFRVELCTGERLFIKAAAAAGWSDGVFPAEARSLRELRRPGALVVPRVVGATAEWLALEWLEPVRATPALWSALGTGLAVTHRSTAGEHGWDTDNWIGPLAQRNDRSAEWQAFWREQRLRPQLAAAAPLLERDTVAAAERLLGELDERLGAASAEPPSLLHGDLWSGNVHMSEAGAGVVDPASYYGHREVDLAMAALFGGFAPEFRAAYEREWPLTRGAASREPIYQLYYLLVHVVLFGRSYAAGVARAVEAALA